MTTRRDSVGKALADLNSPSRSPSALLSWRPGGSPLLCHLFVLTLFGVATVVWMRPLLMHGADGVAVKPAGDQLWQVSLLEAQMRSLVSAPGTFFQGYFYYGMGNALFGSDLLLGLLLIFFP